MRLLSVVFVLLSFSSVPIPASATMKAFKRGLRRVFGRPTAPPEPEVVRRPIAIARAESPRDPDLDRPFNVGQLPSGYGESIRLDGNHHQVLTVKSKLCTITLEFKGRYNEMHLDPSIIHLLEQGSCLRGEITSDNEQRSLDRHDMLVVKADGGGRRIKCERAEDTPAYTFQIGSVGDPVPHGWDPDMARDIPKGTPERAAATRICASLYALQVRVRRLALAAK